jgi:glutamyl-Q tRNA(Asp) synthetase
LGPSSLSPTKYIGRFAPSPSGPLHFGSLLCAAASFLQARSQAGLWHIRIEDLDTYREQRGATSEILNSLEDFGLTWDGPVIYQSKRQQNYQQALDKLAKIDRTYPCACSRKMLYRDPQYAANLIYPGTCRDGIAKDKTARAIRLRTEPHLIEFNDAIFGEFKQSISQQVGDFILRRGDGLIAYQLAVVVDDAAANITEVVRGADLLDNTPRQIYLQQLLGFNTPSYLHIPIITNQLGQKLSKQSHAPAITSDSVVPTLHHVLSLLGQQPPNNLLDGQIDELWQWSVANWRLDAVPKLTTLPL